MSHPVAFEAARGLAKSYGERLRGCNVRNMNPEKADGVSPELQIARFRVNAVHTAQAMLKFDPNYAGGHLALALVLSHTGDKSTAQTEYETAARQWSQADPDMTEMKLLQVVTAN